MLSTQMSLLCWTSVSMIALALADIGRSRIAALIPKFWFMSLGLMHYIFFDRATLRGNILAVF